MRTELVTGVLEEPGEESAVLTEAGDDSAAKRTMAGSSSSEWAEADKVIAAEGYGKRG